MIEKDEYLKAKRTVQEYEGINPLDIDLPWIEKDSLAGKRLIEIYNETPEESIIFEISSKVLRQLIVEGIDIGISQKTNLINTNLIKKLIIEFKNSLSDVNHNIQVYEKMDYIFITDEDRKSTIDDLKKIKSSLEKDIKTLGGEI